MSYCDAAVVRVLQNSEPLAYRHLLNLIKLMGIDWRFCLQWAQGVFLYSATLLKKKSAARYSSVTDRISCI